MNAQDAQALRAELRTGEESKTHPFHLAAFLMDRARSKKLNVNPFQVSLDAEIFMRLSKRVANYALNDCNRGLNESQEKAREKVADQIRALASFYKLNALTSGDPRGYVVRLDGEGVAKNGWGDGFGIA